MANVYVRSGAGGAGTGADWTNAYTTLGAALTAKAAGDDFWVAGDHAETAASAKTLTSPGTAANPAKIHCVNHAGSVPPVAADLLTTATITTTGASDIILVGYAFCYGVTFSAGDSTNLGSLNFGNSAAHGWKLESCKLTLGNSNASSVINVGAGGGNSSSSWFNTVVKFASVSQKISISIDGFRWTGQNSSVDAAGSIPTGLFSTSASRQSAFLVEGVDLSALGSGKTIQPAIITAGRPIFKDCKLGASVTKAASPTVPGSQVEFIRCDSADTNYQHDLYSYYGTTNIETTIVLTGGASDGVTPISHKIVTSANAKWINPFRSIPITFWNETVGSAITITLQGIWGGGAVPNNDDIWMETEYSGDASFPIGYLARGTKASNLAANSAQAAGAGTWGGSTTKFTLTATITPQNKGPITLYIMAGAASSTFYIDPKPVIT